MDAFYASVEQQRRPELRGKPVIVGHDGPRGVVAAASYEARRFGVHSAMPSAIARRLCAQAVFVPADFEAYRDVSARVFRVLRQYTPIIEPLSLDEAFLDLSGDRNARADAEGTARRIKADVVAATAGLTASVGAATCKVVAKVASDLRKPDGLVIVAPGHEAEFLAPLPMRVLPGLGPAAARRLTDLGLRTCADLAALSDDVLQARLGSNGPALRRMALGDDPRTVVVPGLPKSISRETTFESDVEDRSELRRVARALAQDVTRSLRAHHLYSRTVRLKLRYPDFDTHTHQATLPVATDLDMEFLGALDRLMGEALPQARPVRLIGVAAAGLAEEVQQPLLDAARQKARALDESLDSLRGRLGRAAPTRGSHLAERQLDSDRSWRRDDIEAVTTPDP
jgi:DNA polymerase-4